MVFFSFTFVVLLLIIVHFFLSVLQILIPRTPFSLKNFFFLISDNNSIIIIIIIIITRRCYRYTSACAREAVGVVSGTIFRERTAAADIWLILPYYFFFPNSRVIPWSQRKSRLIATEECCTILILRPRPSTLSIYTPVGGFSFKLKKKKTLVYTTRRTRGAGMPKILTCIVKIYCKNSVYNVYIILWRWRWMVVLLYMYTNIIIMYKKKKSRKIKEQNGMIFLIKMSRFLFTKINY